jgi:hypothetical protein
MLILENLKQFFFASVLFVTAVSIHWNFVGLNSNSTQRSGLASKPMQIEKQIQFNVSKEKIALASNSQNLNL